MSNLKSCKSIVKSFFLENNIYIHKIIILILIWNIMVIITKKRVLMLIEILIILIGFCMLYTTTYDKELTPSNVLKAGGVALAILFIWFQTKDLYFSTNRFILWVPP